jgi:hypothetical protein
MMFVPSDQKNLGVHTGMLAVDPKHINPTTSGGAGPATNILYGGKAYVDIGRERAGLTYLRDNCRHNPL